MCLKSPDCGSDIIFEEIIKMKTKKENKTRAPLRESISRMINKFKRVVL